MYLKAFEMFPLDLESEDHDGRSIFDRYDDGSDGMSYP
jgi:hypothetical protein